MSIVVLFCACVLHHVDPMASVGIKVMNWCHRLLEVKTLGEGSFGQSLREASPALHRRERLGKTSAVHENPVTTSKAPVTRSDALVSNSFLLLLVRHLLLEAMHLFLLVVTDFIFFS